MVRRFGEQQEWIGRRIEPWTRSAQGAKTNCVINVDIIQDSLGKSEVLYKPRGGGRVGERGNLEFYFSSHLC